MAEIIKTILSPDDLAAEELRERTRAEDEARIKEEIRRERDLLAPDGDMDVTNKDQQAGRVLPRSLVVQRLRKLNPSLVYEQSNNYPDKGGIYFNGYLEDSYTGDCEYGHWFICGMPHESVREFDLRISVPSVIPDPTIALHWQSIDKVDSRERGWRSIILTLVKTGLIELERAKKVFHLEDGRSSKYWKQSVN